MNRVVPIAGAALVSAFASEARAVATASSCEVILQPEDADPFWQQAVSELKTRLGERAAGDVDCGAIEVLAAGPQSSVRFTTRDGRRAERPVSAPGGLLAIVQALAITLPEPSPQPDSSSASLPAVGPSKIERDQLPKPAAPEPASIEATRARFLVGASGGMRVASAASMTFGSLSFGIGVGVNVGHWEVSVLGQYDPAQLSLPGSAAGLSMSTYALGLRAGRRDRVGSVDGAYGLTTSIVLTNETRDSPNGNQQGGQGSLAETAEPRAGVFAGVVMSRHAKLRLRPEIGFDVIATRIGSPWSRVDRQLPAPWWSTSVSLGLEWEATP